MGTELFIDDVTYDEILLDFNEMSVVVKNGNFYIVDKEKKVAIGVTDEQFDIMLGGCFELLTGDVS